MSGSISRKRKHKTFRQQSKEEVRWYMKFFEDIIDDHHDRTMFPYSEYTTLTPEQLLRLVQGELIRKKWHFESYEIRHSIENRGS